MRLHVEAMTYGPAAIAHEEDGKAVFVEGAVAGDVVEAEVVSEDKRFDRVRTLEVLEPSPERVTPPCPLVGVCGGCPWGALSHGEQVRAKEANIASALQRTGGLSEERLGEVLRPLVSPSAPWGYRNKVELAVAATERGLKLGFHDLSGEHVVAVDACPLLPKRFEKLPKKVAGAVSYLARGHALEILRVGVRASERTNDVEIALWTPPSGFPRGFSAKVLAEGTGATGVVRVMQKGPKKARTLAGFEVLGGRARWRERLDGHRMAVSAPSFFQVNTEGAEALIELVLAAADECARVLDAPLEELGAWDLYSGAGTFTLPLARRLGWVEAVEAFGPAVRDLRANLEVAGLENVEAVGGDAAREMPGDSADLIICDPPRAGLSKEAVAGLSEAGEAKRLVYVSCDPQTLARDVQRLESAGTWRLARVVPVDLFPETYHMECVATFTPKGASGAASHGVA